MSKRGLLYFAAVLLAFLIILPGMATAEDSTSGYTNVTVSEAESMIEEGDVYILDVRTPDEFHAAHIKGAVLIPIASLKNPPGEPVLPDEYLLKNRMGELPADKNAKILIYCKTGSRSLNASKMLAGAEYTNIYNMEAGIKVWIDEGYPVAITFVDELDSIDGSTRTTLNAKLDNVLCHLEKRSECKAIKKIDKFICFVDEMENECRLDSDDAAYLIHEASVHLKDLIL